jgi:pimeloyl-ACP methyl ester carboxylesterase
VSRRPGSTRSWLLVAGLTWLLNLLRWARHTRPEPLPAPPRGSATVVADDGTRLYAEVTGPADAGSTMVFVHGFLARTIEWDMQVSHFTERARVIRYDHRNHGRSGRSSKQIDVRTLARDLACVLEQLAPTGPVVLVGHSMGGMTVLALALERPDLFRERIVGTALLASGAGHYVEGHPVENAVRFASRRHLLALGLLVFRLLAPALERVRPRRTHTMRRVTRKVMFGSADVDPAMLAMTHELLEEPPLSTLASLQGALLRHEVLDALPVVGTRPALVLTGSDDRLTRPEHSARMAQDLGPAADLVVVPGAGHVVNQTRPVETNAALDRLLDRVSASTRSASSAA